MTYGPADLYVVEFARCSVPALVTAILRDAATSGVITLLDVALVRTVEDGSSELLELDEFSDEFELTGLRPPEAGLIGMDDIDELAVDFRPGTSCLVVLLENTWVRRVSRAAEFADARVVAVQRFPSEAVRGVAALAVTE